MSRQNWFSVLLYVFYVLLCPVTRRACTGHICVHSLHYWYMNKVFSIFFVKDFRTQAYKTDNLRTSLKPAARPNGPTMHATIMTMRRCMMRRRVHFSMVDSIKAFFYHVTDSLEYTLVIEETGRWNQEQASFPSALFEPSKGFSPESNQAVVDLTSHPPNRNSVSIPQRTHILLLTSGETRRRGRVHSSMV
jgi:hypothetical protein